MDHRPLTERTMHVIVASADPARATAWIRIVGLLAEWGGHPCRPTIDVWRIQHQERLL